jgi:hypothetical protein
MARKTGSASTVSATRALAPQDESMSDARQAEQIFAAWQRENKFLLSRTLKLRVAVA